MNRIISELKSQPLIGAVTIIGTALAVFMIMVVVMLQSVSTTPFAPESNRDRLLFGEFVHLKGINDQEGNEQSMSTSLHYIKELYSDLPGVERISYAIMGDDRTDVQVPGSRPYSIDIRYVDDAFFDIFDFRFVSGKPFDNAASEAGLPVAVITENIARTLYGTSDATGREIFISQKPYTVAGVVKDVSTLAWNAYSQVFIPYMNTGRQNQTYGPPEGGPFQAYLLRESGADVADIKAEIQRRIEALSTLKRADNFEIVYHDQPFTIEQKLEPHGSNTTPDPTTSRRQRYGIYLVLLIIPAINLSSMTQSRLRRRVSEVGVRRAFGCTRSRVILDIIGENMIVTLIGGVIGLLLSVVFAWIYCSMTTATYGSLSTGAMLDASMLISWSTLGFAILFCFFLNILSSGIPAWRASRLNPVEALGGINR